MKIYLQLYMNKIFLIILKIHLIETVYLIPSLIIFMEMNTIVKLFVIKFMIT